MAGQLGMVVVEAGDRRVDAVVDGLATIVRTTLGS
jgi:hypothetical protein